MRELARLSFTRDAERVLADSHEAHRLVMRAFADDIGGRKGANVLFRVEDARTLLVQHEGVATWDSLGPLLQSYRAKDIEEAHRAIRTGQTLRFMLVANPTFDAVVDGKRRRTAVRDAARQTDWMTRKLDQCGARLVTADGVAQLSVGATWQQTSRRGGQRITHWAVAFRGMLEVLDHERFFEALGAGVGRGRAYGFGLLTVAG